MARKCRAVSASGQRRIEKIIAVGWRPTRRERAKLRAKEIISAAN